MAGIFAGLLLRWRRLHWSWGLVFAALGAVLLAVWGPGGFQALGALRREFLTSGGVLLLQPHWSVLAQRWVVMAAWSLPICGVGASALKLYYDRRARLAGGQAARQVALTPTPAALARRISARLSKGPANWGYAHGVRLGVDARGGAVHIPWQALEHHDAVLGASRQGKTNTALTISAGTLAAGWGQVILDLRGDPHQAERARLLAKRHRRPFWYWSIDEPPWRSLAAHRCTCNFLSAGTLTDRRDLLYRPEQSLGNIEDRPAVFHLLRLALEVAELDGDIPTLADVAELLHPAVLRHRLAQADTQRFSDDLTWLVGLDPSDKTAALSLRRRIKGYLASPAGSWLGPREDARALELADPIVSGGVAVISIDTKSFAELGAVIASYAIQGLSAVCGALQRQAGFIDARLVIDEVSALDGNQLVLLLERAQSVGVRVSLVAPSVASLAATGGHQLVGALFDRSAYIVSHRQSAQDAADLVSELGSSYRTVISVHEDAVIAPLRLGRRRWQRAASADVGVCGSDDVNALGRGEAAIWLREPTPRSSTVTVDPPQAAEELGRLAMENTSVGPMRRGKRKVGV